MYVAVLEFVELTEKTESTKPHPLSKFSQCNVDTPPFPVRILSNEEVMDQPTTGRCMMIISEFAWYFALDLKKVKMCDCSDLLGSKSSHTIQLYLSDIIL